jgi:hypothetical protein
MTVALHVLSTPAEPVLLDREPLDTSDVREVRHWIRVYTSLLELAANFPQAARENQSLARSLIVWQERLDFWRGRAPEIRNPSSP